MSPALVLLGVAVLLTAGVAGAIGSRWRTMWTLPGAGALVSTIAGVIGWLACYGAALSADRGTAEHLRDLASIGTLVSAAGIAWFAARFTGRDALLSWGTFAGFAGTTVLLSVWAATDAGNLFRLPHDTVDRATGPIAWAAMVWVLALLGVAVWQLARHRRTVTPQQQGLTDVLNAAMGFMLLSSAVHAVGLGQQPVDVGLVGRIAALAGSVFALRQGLAPDIEAMARAAFVEGMTDGVIVVDHEDAIAVMNERASAMLGMHPADAMGHRLADLKGDDRAWRACLARALTVAEVRDARGERMHVRTERLPLRDRGGHRLGTAILIRDVTPMYLDPLTGISNRRCFQDSAPELLDAAAAEGQDVCIVAMDLDNLKLVNDTHGHLVGDQAIAQAALAMREGLRVGDRLARLSGDEFVALIAGAGTSRAVEIVERLRERVEALALGVTLTAGVAQVSADGDLLGALRRADDALYAAKRAGRNRVHTIA